MIKMKILIGLGTVFLACSSLMGYGNDGHHNKQDWDESKMQEMHEKRMDRMTENLDLTDDQRSKIEAIKKKHLEEAKPLHQKLMELKKSTHEEIRGVLTDEQKKKYDEMKAKKHEKMKEKKGKRQKKKK